MHVPTCRAPILQGQRSAHTENRVVWALSVGPIAALPFSSGALSTCTTPLAQPSSSFAEVPAAGICDQPEMFPLWDHDVYTFIGCTAPGADQVAGWCAGTQADCLTSLATVANSGNPWPLANNPAQGGAECGITKPGACTKSEVRIHMLGRCALHVAVLWPLSLDVFSQGSVGVGKGR